MKRNRWKREGRRRLKFEARISNLRKLLLKHVTYVLSFFFFSLLLLCFFIVSQRFASLSAWKRVYARIKIRIRANLSKYIIKIIYARLTANVKTLKPFLTRFNNRIDFSNFLKLPPFSMDINFLSPELDWSIVIIYVYIHRTMLHYLYIYIYIYFLNLLDNRTKLIGEEIYLIDNSRTQ